MTLFNRIVRLLRAAGITVLAVLSFSLILLTVDKKLSERAERKKSDIGSEGIQSLETWRIGGIDQRVMIRGKNRSNPVIVFLHGGPGSAQIGFARAFDAELEKHFTIVNWDQRGAGLTFSFFTPAESFSKEQFLADTLEVIEKAKVRLGQDKVFLVGHSWGAYLGAITAARHPGHLHAYIGVGQMVNSLENENVSLDFVLGEAARQNNKEALAELQSIGRPPYAGLEQIGVQRRWLGEFGGAMFHGAHRHDAYSYLGSLMWASPEMRMADQLWYFAGIYRSLNLFLPGFYTLDLYKEAPRIDVPVYFLQGRHDYNTPSPIVQKYYGLLAAQKKKIIWFEHSAHAPNFEEPAAFAAAMHQVRQEILGH